MEKEKQIILKTLEEAKNAVHAFYVRNGDRDVCGFSWVEVTHYQGKKIRSNSKIGKLLQEMKFIQDRTGFIYWNPGKACVQSKNVIEAGSNAAADFLNKNGFVARAASRID